MKSFLLKTLILILVPTIIFVPVYAILISASITNSKDYSEIVQGQWNVFQYYYENQRIACNADIWMTVKFDDKSIVVDGTVLPKTETEVTWISSSSLKYDVDGETYTFLLSFDSNDNLKIVVDGTSYIILLRKSEG